MKLLIVDDHLIFLQGASYIFSEVIDNAVVSTASSVDSAITKLEDDPSIDLVLMDLQMPGAVGIEPLIDIRTRFPLVPIIVLSASEDPVIIKACLDRGAAGFIPKSFDAMAMLSAIEEVLAGGEFVPSSVKDQIRNQHQEKQETVSLTARQHQVLREVSNGLSNKAIAERLDIAENTVKVHIVTIYRLLGVESRIACVKRAQALDLV